MKKAMWIILLALAILIGWRLYQHKKNAASDGKKQGRAGMATPVEVSPVVISTMRDTGNFSGSLKPRSGYSLAPRVSGRLSKLMVHLGDKVSNGQLVAVLDDDVYQQNLEQAKAELAVVNAQVEQTRLALKAANSNWDATKSLFDKNYTTKAEMDKTDSDKAAAQAKYDIALAEVQRAKAVVKTAEIQLSYTQIRATWNGGANTRFVGERLVDEGSTIPANTPILTLIDNSVVTAEIDVIERDYARIKLGQQVQVTTDAYPEKTFTGVLARMAPMLQEASRQARAEIDIPNSDGMLKPGMFVRVQIVYAVHKNVTAVPIASLVKRDGKTGVFLADETALTASFIPLTIGIQEDALAEVTEPELTGKVVTLGQEQLQDKGKIKLPQDSDKGMKSKGNKGAKA